MKAAAGKTYTFIRKIFMLNFILIFFRENLSTFLQKLCNYLRFSGKVSENIANLFYEKFSQNLQKYNVQKILSQKYPV
jgi:hypothetical protein